MATRSAEAQRKILNVATAIETEPDRYYQRWYAAVREDIYAAAGSPADWKPGEPACKTAFCIAGWNHVLHHFVDDDYLYVEPFGGRGMDEEWLQADFAYPIYSTEIARDFELDDRAAEMLVWSEWRPRRGLTVPEALRHLATGSPVSDITDTVLAEWGMG